MNDTIRYNKSTMERRVGERSISAFCLLSSTFCPLSSVQAAPQLLVPPQGAYNGAYVDFGDDEDSVTLDGINEFATLIGKRQAIIGFGNNWGKNAFPSAQVRIVHNSGAVPLIFWYAREISNEVPTSQFNLESINAGKWDQYLDNWANNAKAIAGPILVSWGLEMNGNWYPWSGVNHGGGKIIPNTNPPQFQGPETFKQAYRHIVDRIRAAGAVNIAWVFHVNNIAFPPSPWNTMANYYPGPNYADWIGISAYGTQAPHAMWYKVKDTLLNPYKELMQVDLSKPILIAEWGIGEFPKRGSKAEWIKQAMNAMPTLPRLKGAVFWHERWQNADLSYSNLRVNSSLEALNAYREAIANLFWLERPVLSTPTSGGALH